MCVPCCSRKIHAKSDPPNLRQTRCCLQRSSIFVDLVHRKFICFCLFGIFSAFHLVEFVFPPWGKSRWHTSSCWFHQPPYLLTETFTLAEVQCFSSATWLFLIVASLSPLLRLSVSLAFHSNQTTNGGPGRLLRQAIRTCRNPL